MSATLPPSASVRRFDPPSVAPAPHFDRVFKILGVPIHDVTKDQARDWVLHHLANCGSSGSAAAYFVNAHTLNLAAADREYRSLLSRGNAIFGDGTGVRWAAKLQGIRVRDNLVGTDFVPHLFKTSPPNQFSYFMLGATQETVDKAAEYAGREFPRWRQAGVHHGYVKDEAVSRAAIKQINASGADVVLVGMGNPIQERWIERWKGEIKAPVCLGIGGLFDYWAGNVERAPQWVRKIGYEWAWRLYQEPGAKARRYLIGNPLFLYHITRERLLPKRS
jgi:N-acetylglucosaminyldiphosphoundecaprenol N-acetyl-beta-D-mannosaminyltransferase